MPELSPEFVKRVLEATAPEGDPRDALVLADAFLERGEPRRAAAALDRAYGLAPRDADIARHRAAVLDSLEIVEHGLRFRFVPGGPFLMGCPDGDPDERPVHVAKTSEFWMAEVPLSWAAYCRLLGWKPPPDACPGEDMPDRDEAFRLYEQNKIRFQYCAGGANGAGPSAVDSPDGPAPSAYDAKPMVAVTVRETELLCSKLSNAKVEYGRPTEAEWEKAARGGLIGARYAWGNEPPSSARCDFGHFGEFSVHEPGRYPPNGYGLRAICGTVLEWTCDRYDALAYRSPRPEVAAVLNAAVQGEAAWVVRGGSWSDCAEACTVSFRASAEGDEISPNHGFRLVRRERA